MKSIYKKYFRTVALVWAGCFLLFLLVYMIVLAPQKKSKKNIEKQLAEKKQIYDSVIKTAEEETRIRLNEQLEQLRNSLKDFVINSKDSANLTFDISQIASERRVADFSIRTKDKNRGTGIPNCNYISENHIDISFVADFNQFATFLNSLERHWPVIFVDKFAITSSRQNELSHPVSMNLTVFVKKKQES